MSILKIKSTIFSPPTPYPQPITLILKVPIPPPHNSLHHQPHQTYVPPPLFPLHWPQIPRPLHSVYPSCIPIPCININITTAILIILGGYVVYLHSVVITPHINNGLCFASWGDSMMINKPTRCAAAHIKCHKSTEQSVWILPRSGLALTKIKPLSGLRP